MLAFFGIGNKNSAPPVNATPPDPLQECLTKYKTNSETVAFRRAAQHGDLPSLTLLLKTGHASLINDTITAVDGMNPLQYAIRFIKDPIVLKNTIEFLLKNACDPAHQDANDRNAISYLETYVEDLVERTYLISLCEEQMDVSVDTRNEAIRKKIQQTDEETTQNTFYNSFFPDQGKGEKEIKSESENVSREEMHQNFNVLEKKLIQERLHQSVSEIEKAMKYLSENFSHLDQHEHAGKHKKELSELLSEKKQIQEHLEYLKTKTPLGLEFENKIFRIIRQIQGLLNLFSQTANSLELETFKNNILQLVDAFKKIKNDLSQLRKFLMEFQLSFAPLRVNIKYMVNTETVEFLPPNDQATQYSLLCSPKLLSTKSAPISTAAPTPAGYGEIAYIANLGSGHNTLRIGKRVSATQIFTVLKISTTNPSDKILLTGVRDAGPHSSAHCVISKANNTREVLRAYTRNCRAQDIWYESETTTLIKSHGPRPPK